MSAARILVGTDGSPSSERAVRWAARTAADRAGGLHIVHALDLASAETVFGPFDLFIPPVTAALRERGAAVLDAARRIAGDVEPRLRVETELTDEGPAPALIRRSESALMTVIGGAGTRGDLPLHLGSTLLAVSAHGHGTVTVVDGDSAHTGPDDGPVVVGVDGSRFGRAAVEVAFLEAHRRQAPLVAVHCRTDLRFASLAGIATGPEDPAARASAAAVQADHLAEWSHTFPDVRVTQEVHRYGPAHHLLEWSRSAQLIVVGSRGRGGFRGLLLGSTSNTLVQHAHCAVMVVHPR
ncbi:universal stress protein [Nocardia neocaledoniensis]|uniref:universal stress protein n=1 Tax=Nocardia neocaledoniensis TaxID=236511 RepID=UPI0024549B0E|nr:universal stress protein [Nocardia neocaledoniensis]